MTKAIVIRAGDPTLAGAIAGGVESAELDRMRTELNRMRAELGVRRERDSKYWAAKIAEAERKYGKPRRISGMEVFLAWLAESIRAWRSGR